LLLAAEDGRNLARALGAPLAEVAKRFPENITIEKDNGVQRLE